MISLRVTKLGYGKDMCLFYRALAKAHGKRPMEFVFDSDLTTYANLARLNEMGINFLTLCRRSKRALETVESAPKDQWTTVRLSNGGCCYHNPCILESSITLRAYPQSLRQIAITKTWGTKNLRC